ncbi:bifunctional 3'-5' exonuclease/ATP-dependent helicase WRN-like [Dreissena polymorpha]|uniref:DEAD/DEAH-box helicase domain-containing protein n=1 Tax=Dreissena polymorpha TaxID=45954 RepID=A0A9D3YW21_DREPO|nr:bifunctional 3'-5' exonuclease/ATP-dependent helicase WRN-like [Dreissena polymorpha]KAH3708420.1 hypothetical protein DPMN_067870 [Dreissena polymorpha]
MASPRDIILEVAKKGGLPMALKDLLIKALLCVIEKRDIMAILPTCYCKSLIYQLTPLILKDYYNLQKSVCIVLTPLNSIMQDQIIALKRIGVQACCVDYNCQCDQALFDDDDDKGVAKSDGDVILTVPMSDIADGKFTLVYSNPDALLSTDTWKSMIQNMENKKIISCIAVDEAHMILEW